MLVELYRSPLRAQFTRALEAVERELLVAAPFIKLAEAEIICAKLSQGRRASLPKLDLVTDLRAESVLSGALDLEALLAFQTRLPRTNVFALPHLHAKVYIFDNSLAIVGSANLTSAALDSNYEYCVGIAEIETIGRIRRDIESYARLGGPVSASQLSALLSEAQDLKAEYDAVQKTAASKAVRRFAAKLQRSRQRFMEVHVGERSANAIFSEAVLQALAAGPATTQQLHPVVQHMLPDLCDDSRELVINGQRFGKVWKHQVRIAQQHLKRRGLIRFDGRAWEITPAGN